VSLLPMINQAQNALDSGKDVYVSGPALGTKSVRISSIEALTTELIRIRAATRSDLEYIVPVRAVDGIAIITQSGK
jgi:hypothetical protein